MSRPFGEATLLSLPVWAVQSPQIPLSSVFCRPFSVLITKMCYTIAMKFFGKSLGSRKGAQDKASGPSTRTILLAGRGTSPMVLMETELEKELT